MSTWRDPIGGKLSVVDEETFEHLADRATCGGEALYLYFEWGKRTQRQLLVDDYGDIHWMPSLAWPDPPKMEEFID